MNNDYLIQKNSLDAKEIYLLIKEDKKENFIKENLFILKNKSNKLINNKKYFLKLLELDINYVEYIGEDLKKDKDIVKFLLSNNYDLKRVFKNKELEDKHFLLELLEKIDIMQLKEHIFSNFIKKEMLSFKHFNTTHYKDGISENNFLKSIIKEFDKDLDFLVSELSKKECLGLDTIYYIIKDKNIYVMKDFINKIPSFTKRVFFKDVFNLSEKILSEIDLHKQIFRKLNNCSNFDEEIGILFNFFYRFNHRYIKEEISIQKKLINAKTIKNEKNRVQYLLDSSAYYPYLIKNSSVDFLNLYRKEISQSKEFKGIRTKEKIIKKQLEEFFVSAKKEKELHGYSKKNCYEISKIIIEKRLMNNNLDISDFLLEEICMEPNFLGIKEEKIQVFFAIIDYVLLSESQIKKMIDIYLELNKESLDNKDILKYKKCNQEYSLKEYLLFFYGNEYKDIIESYSEKEKNVFVIEEEKDKTEQQAKEIPNQKKQELSEYVKPNYKELLSDNNSNEDVLKRIEYYQKEIKNIHNIKYSFDISEVSGMIQEKNNGTKIPLEKKVSVLVENMSKYSKFQNYKIKELEDCNCSCKSLSNEIIVSIEKEQEQELKQRENTNNISKYKGYVEELYDSIDLFSKNIDFIDDSVDIKESQQKNVLEIIKKSKYLVEIEKVEKMKERLLSLINILDNHLLNSSNVEMDYNRNIYNAKDIVDNVYNVFESSLNNYLIYFYDNNEKTDNKMQEIKKEENKSVIKDIVKKIKGVFIKDSKNEGECLLELNKEIEVFLNNNKNTKKIFF
jgi:hypothetical protein